MTNILTALPQFDTSRYTHIVPSLEKALVSTADLLTLDAVDVAKRAQVPPGEVKKLADALLDALRADAPPDDDGPGAFNALQNGGHVAGRWATVSTLDDELDDALGGGIALGHMTEIVGESAAGKTQMLLTLLLAVQLPESRPPGSKQQRSALYISTEAPLSTSRLTQILKKHPKLADLSDDDRPSLNRIHSTHIHDLEAQEHIIRYQVPVAIQKHNVGLLVVDSIAANYRAEFDKGRTGNGAESMAKRSIQLAQTGALLQSLARTHNIAVVVANQVADRFLRTDPTLHAVSQATQGARAGSPARSVANSRTSTQQQSTFSVLSTDDPLALDHQQSFFTGWGDDPSVSNLKTPSLGLVWTNQLATRIALLKDPVYEDKIYAAGDERNLIGWNRSCKVVFSAWCSETTTAFEIWEGGVRSTRSTERTAEGGAAQKT